MATDYKNTLNLPRTDFPMKADLVAREPERLKKWEAAKLYQKIQTSRVTAEKFVLHDGPPFANGDVHIGTALNKILKDIIVKYQTLRGKSAPYIPGWDCHGLPIEFKVSQDMRKAGDATADASTIRKACDAYARKFIDIQRAQFKRLGVLGDWENPYLTLNKEYEADELRLFADIVAKGFVYRGKKPVYWSIPCRTALAEAEVEYHDHVSQSVFVKFPVVGRKKTFVVIWTTTPWTLPANLAVAFNPNFQHSLIKVGDEKFIVSDRHLIQIATQCGLSEFQNEKPLSAEELASVEYQHPFCSRTGRLFPATFVDDSTGTGFVHIAPGHGLEDYQLGLSVGLPIYSPVDDDGKFAYTNDLPIERQMPKEMIGKSILEKHGDGKSEANEIVLAELRHRNVLLSQEKYPHSYPFCWRSKTPVIFRAMDQWFIKIDHVLPEWKKQSLEHSASFQKTQMFDSLEIDAPVDGSFRRFALFNVIYGVEWIPDWGKNRIYGAIESRPDWCISRQRTWGVPIPAFYDAKGEPMLDAQIVRNAADLIEQHGSNIWFEKSASELWALVKPANWTGAEAVAKSSDTLDVWIDSGSSSRAVLMRREELQHKVGQADVYLEGSDQHRGWFQSSLLLSLAGNGAAPFKTVLTHGFMVDADREKISKSKQGGYEKPQTAEAYVKKYGADVVRLWVASQDYRSDVVVSEERINKVGETYRGIRNALRYQLSNLYDFDPAQHSVPDEKLTGLDRWILGEFAKLEAEVLAAYDQYEFHVVYQKLSQFIAVELSSVYHDVIKDRLYTDAANSPRRRSTQTALHRLVTGLCQMLAPILAFTADEAWEFVPGKNVNFVHEVNWKPNPFAISENEQNVLKNLFELRRITLPELEKYRQSKAIGKSLDAKLLMIGSAKPIISAPDHKEFLRELLNVSQLEVRAEPEKSDIMETDLNRLNLRLKNEFFGELEIQVAKADGQKCERCWHWETDVGKNVEHPTICGRCVEAVMQAPDVSVK
jgi:isoleucyl-tRNA synthetase